MRSIQPTNPLERRALREILAERLAQLARYHHSDDADDDLPVHSLIERARDYAAISAENLRGTLPSSNPQAAWRQGIKSAATLLAALDTLERRMGDRLPPENVTPDLFSG